MGFLYRKTAHVLPPVVWCCGTARGSSRVSGSMLLKVLFKETLIVKLLFNIENCTFPFKNILFHEMMSTLNSFKAFKGWTSSLLKLKHWLVEQLALCTRCETLKVGLVMTAFCIWAGVQVSMTWQESGKKRGVRQTVLMVGPRNSVFSETLQKPALPSRLWPPGLRPTLTGIVPGAGVGSPWERGCGLGESWVRAAP